MWSFLSQTLGLNPQQPARSKSPGGRWHKWARLGVEQLEDRCVPAFFVVNDFGDAGAGVEDSGDLRYCITEARNSGDGPHTISIHLGDTSRVINLNTVLPVLNKDITFEVLATVGMTIVGQPPPPTPTLTVQRNPAAGTPKFRIFEIAQEETVNISAMKIANGLLDAAGEGGGGIYNAGTLNLYNVEVTKNEAQWHGGGIYNKYEAVLTVENSKIHDNRVPQDASGGGIYNNGHAWVQWGTELCHCVFPVQRADCPAFSHANLLCWFLAPQAT